MEEWRWIFCDILFEYFFHFELFVLFYFLGDWNRHTFEFELIEALEVSLLKIKIPVIISRSSNQWWWTPAIWWHPKLVSNSELHSLCFSNIVLEMISCWSTIVYNIEYILENSSMHIWNCDLIVHLICLGLRASIEDIRRFYFFCFFVLPKQESRILLFFSHKPNGSTF